MYSNNKTLNTSSNINKNKSNFQNRNSNSDKPIKKEFNLSPLKSDLVKPKPALPFNKNPSHIQNGNAKDSTHESAMDKDSQTIRPSGKCRLFIGNINNDMTEEELKILFKDYGQITESFVSNRGFGFIKLESKFMADKAKHDLDGTMYKGKMIRVRIATTGTALKVLNLSPNVTNETLIKAFSVFGPLDNVVVVADERGKSVGEGIVEFSRKNQAQIAMQKINEGVFLLTSSLKPVVVEPYETKDYEEGVAEKTVTKTATFLKETEQLPRFVQPGSFEYDYGNKWKALYQQEKIQRELLEKKILEDREVLENDMESTLHEHQTMMLRQDLMRRQEELQRMEEARFRFMKQKEDHERVKAERRGGDMNMFQPSFNSFQPPPFGSKGQFQMPGNNQMGNDMNKGDKINSRGNMFNSIDGFNMPPQQQQQQGPGINMTGGGGQTQHTPNLINIKGLQGGGNSNANAQQQQQQSGSSNINLNKGSLVPSLMDNGPVSQNNMMASSSAPNTVHNKIGTITGGGIKPLFPSSHQQQQQQQNQNMGHQQASMPPQFGNMGARSSMHQGMPPPLMGGGGPHQFPFGAGPSMNNNRMMMMGGEDFMMNDNSKRARRF